MEYFLQNNFKKFIYLIFIFIISQIIGSFSVAAQQETRSADQSNNQKTKNSQESKETATGNPLYQDFPDWLIVKPFIRNSSFEFSIKSEETQRVIDYKPNVYASYGVSLAYSIFGISLSSKFANADKDPLTYGESSYLDFQFNYYGRKLGIDFNIAHYKGFYIQNSGDFIEGSSAAKNILYPDLEGNMIGVNAYYIFSPNQLSLIAAFDHSARQLKSGGSFLLMVSYFQSGIVNTGSIIPSSVQADFGSVSSFSEAGALTLSGAPGYAYTLVWRGFYLTPVVFLGAGAQAQGFKSPNDQTIINQVTLVIKINWRIAAGYNGERFFTGVMLQDDMNQIQNRSSNMTLTAHLLALQFFLGYRLG